MTKVLTRIPGYGGKSICDVLGENNKSYALRTVLRQTKLPPALWDSVKANADPSNFEYEYKYFEAKKNKCILLKKENT